MIKKKKKKKSTKINIKFLEKGKTKNNIIWGKIYFETRI